MKIAILCFCVSLLCISMAVLCVHDADCLSEQRNRMIDTYRHASAAAVDGLNACTAGDANSCDATRALLKAMAAQ